MITGIDHIALPVPSLRGAGAPFERLGLRLTPEARHAGLGTANRSFFAGGGETEFYIELLGIADRAEAQAAGRRDLLAAVDAGQPAPRLALRTADADGLRARLDARGVPSILRHVRREDGSAIGRALAVESDAPGCRVTVLEYAEPFPARVARHAAAGLFEHVLALKRVDHLAMVAPDLAGTEAAWRELFGVEATGEVRGRGMVIRQLRMGDAILELLGPDSPDSPLAQRPPGLITMAAFEVPGLEAAVAHARAAGFTLPDGASGVLPGTRVSSIPGDQLGGLTLQLLEYV